MKFLVLIFAAFFVIAVESQSSRLESFDIDTVLKNDRVLTNYIKCILDQGPCTREGRDIKKQLPEVRKKFIAKVLLNSKLDFSLINYKIIILFLSYRHLTQIVQNVPQNGSNK